MLSPIIDNVAEEIKDVNFVKINVDEQSDLAAEFNVQSIPTVYLFKNGQPISKFLGFIPKEQVIDFINKNK